MARPALLIVLLASWPACGGPAVPPDRPMPKASHTFEVPSAIKAEHEEIHAALVAATQAPGRTGEAARELAEVLHPHFVREEELALPPLALLEPLASGDYEPSMANILPVTDALRAEMPKMLDEHKVIGAAARALEEAARDEKQTDIERLAERLQMHALTEEQIYYPAAILVGDLIRTHRK